MSERAELAVGLPERKTLRILRMVGGIARVPSVVYSSIRERIEEGRRKKRAFRFVDGLVEQHLRGEISWPDIFEQIDAASKDPVRRLDYSDMQGWFLYRFFRYRTIGK